MIKFIIGKDPSDIKMFVDRVQVPVPEMLISKLTFSVEAPDKRKLTIESDWFEIEAEVDGQLVSIGDHARPGRVGDWLAGELDPSKTPHAEELRTPTRCHPLDSAWVRYGLRPVEGGNSWRLTQGPGSIELTGNLFADDPYLETLRAAIRLLRRLFAEQGQRSSLRVYDSIGQLSEVYNVDSADAFQAFFD